MLADQSVLDEQLKKAHREAEEREAKRNAQKLGLPYLDLATSPIQVDALHLIKKEDAMRLQVAPFQFKAERAAVGVVNPDGPGVKEFLESLKKEANTVSVYIASLSGLKHVWSYYKYITEDRKKITGQIEIDQENFNRLYEKLTTLPAVKDEVDKFDFKNTPTGRIVEIVLAGALRNRVSDLHFEAQENTTRLRYRIDGILHDVVPDFPGRLYKFLLSRIKLLSNLKLNVTDVPQDGRFSLRLQERDIEFRVSLIPSEYGETVVMRVLDPLNLKAELKDLGFREDDLKIIQEELDQPNGIIMNTGPTGSGKTTTLYAFLIYERDPGVKIITIEDPIEYHLDDIEQTQADPDAGYTFASGLRSMMRQDPDVILVGEIRDKETAEIAIQASLTGHLVFSTIHANSSAGAIPRLLDLGVKAVSIAPALNLVIAQRLVRHLCEKCKKPREIEPEKVAKIKEFIQGLPERVNKENYKDIKIFEPVGCAECSNVGFKGRLAVFGLLRKTKELEALITDNVSMGQIRDQSDKQGMVHMQGDGILKVISGVTTFDEVRDATGPIAIFDGKDEKAKLQKIRSAKEAAEK